MIAKRLLANLRQQFRCNERVLSRWYHYNSQNRYGNGSDDPPKILITGKNRAIDQISVCLSLDRMRRSFKLKVNEINRLLWKWKIIVTPKYLIQVLDAFNSFINLIAGGLGQLGIECAKLLRNRWGEDSVLLSDIIKPNKSICQSGPYIFADILDFKVTHQWRWWRQRQWRRWRSDDNERSLATHNNVVSRLVLSCLVTLIRF